MQAWNPIQVRREEHKTCAHILWELNMQAQILYNTELMHISYENWICSDRSYTIHKLCTYLMGIEYAGTNHTNQKGRTQNLCTYPTRIEYAGTDPTQVKIRAHILRELNMQAQILYKLEFVHLPYENWTCRHNRKGRDRDGDQGYLEARASPKQVEMEMEDKYCPEKFKARAPNGHHKYVSF